MIEISINYKSATSEWVVSEKENGRTKPEKTYYTPDVKDAVDTAIDKVEKDKEKGKDTDLSKADRTKKLVEKHRPDYLAKEAHRATEAILLRKKPTKKEIMATGHPLCFVKDEMVNPPHLPVRDIKEPIPDDVKIMQPPPFSNPMYPLNPNSQ